MEVRLLPMSCYDESFEGKDIEEIQNEFFNDYLKKHNYKFKKGIDAKVKDLILFQIYGKVIAKAYLKEKIYYPKAHKDGYRGEYSFYPKSIKTFEPITESELKKYCSNFKSFNQSMQKLKISNIDKLIERTDEKINKELIKYNRYSRKDIHDMFSPDTKFTTGTGLWGISGIIKVPNTISDYIFIVTYGRSQSGHNFDENIDENGVLNWQSQPQQKLNEKRIKDFINHDYNSSNIYLFLRKSEKVKYSYLGKLAYKTHDLSRECPVYFKWQILDWDSDLGNISLDTNIKTNSELIEKFKEKKELGEIDIKKFTLTLNDDPAFYINTKKEKKNISEFNNKNINFATENSKNTKLGNAGEDLVVKFEKKYLIDNGREDLAKKVIATRNYKGNAEKFDILSFELDGTKKYIEVKTTTGGKENDFRS